VEEDDKGCWSSSNMGHREYHEHQCQFRFVGWRAWREWQPCVDCAQGKDGAGENGSPSRIVINIVNAREWGTWKCAGSCSAPGVFLSAVVVGGGEEKDSGAQGLESKESQPDDGADETGHRLEGKRQDEFLTEQDHMMLLPRLSLCDHSTRVLNFYSRLAINISCGSQSLFPSTFAVSFSSCDDGGFPESISPRGCDRRRTFR
jgi:hypothetical protein